MGTKAASLVINTRTISAFWSDYGDSFLRFSACLSATILLVYKGKILHKTIQSDELTPGAGISKNYCAVDLRMNRGSVHGSYCSNIELGGLISALLYVPIMRMHRGPWPKVSLR